MAEGMTIDRVVRIDYCKVCVPGKCFFSPANISEQNIAQGLVDADLGRGVVKKRVAVGGRGKSGGVRTLVATNKGDRWFFVFGFAKNARANISDPELEALQSLASDLLQLTKSQLKEAVGNGSLQEICHDQ
jgi:hypothetical protein